MGRLAGDPYLRARYAIAARKLVVDRFTAEIIDRQTVALYRRVITRTASSLPTFISEINRAADQRQS
jgi:hypothetical protein